MASAAPIICFIAAAALSASSVALAGSKQKVAPMVLPDFTQQDLSAANGGYALTADDLKLDCKKLTGRIQVGIMQLRGEKADPKTTELARNVQQAATPYVAGTSRGINPEGDQARALSQLRAFNGQLAAKNCPVYDLDAELKPGATNTPRPIPKPRPARTAVPLVPAPAKTP